MLEQTNTKKIDNYRYYLDLGMKYEVKSNNQAFLCYENALYYCKDEKERAEVRKRYNELVNQNMVTVNKTAIVILSYNNLQLTKDCIESLKKHNAYNSYEIIVVDNASEDGSREWLKQQTDIKKVFNDENQGFPQGCNQGIMAAEKNSDIFLLNNDTIVPPNALFWLRMGLYEDECIGAAGSVSNDVVNYQQVPERFSTIEQWMDFAMKNNVWMEHPYEKKGWLVGFAMLIKREALNKVGLLDQRFYPGNYEDNDLSIRLILEGYKLLLCKNSFIYHYGSKAFNKNRVGFQNLLRENEKKLSDKYDFNYIPYSEIDSSIVELIQPLRDGHSVLELGCGLGCTLARIESLYPGITVVGVEDNEKLFNVAKEITDVYQGNIMNSINLPVEEFDYIIIDRTLSRWGDPAQLLKKAKIYLKKGGVIIVSVLNKDCIQDVPDIRGSKLTLEEFVYICNEAQLPIRKFHFRAAKLSQDEEQDCVKLAKEQGKDEALFRAQRFIFEIG